MTPEEIVGKFADALEKFYPIDGQPSDTDLTRIREVVAPLLLQIPYDETGDTHNLIGLIPPVTAYTMHYGAEFAKPTRFGPYNATINDNYRAVVRTCTEAAHKSKRAGSGTKETAWREMAQFILTVVKDTWVQEL